MAETKQQAQAHTETRYLPIEDYGIIGDLTTVALVGKNGSIDWCCLPDFDSLSVFVALLDADKGGSFRLAPVEQESPGTRQMYFPDTNILITRFLTNDRVSEVTDFMPIKPKGTRRYRHHLVRSVHMLHGSHTFQVTCRPAFNYARDPHTLHLSENGAVFRSVALTLALSSSVPLTDDGKMVYTRPLHSLKTNQLSFSWIVPRTRISFHTLLRRERMRRSFWRRDATGCVG